MEAKSHGCSVALSELSAWGLAAKQWLLLQREAVMLPLCGLIFVL